MCSTDKQKLQMSLSTEQHRWFQSKRELVILQVLTFLASFVAQSITNLILHDSKFTLRYTSNPIQK